MRKIALAAVLALAPSIAAAQDAKPAAHGAESLPKACQATSRGAGMMGKGMPMGDMAPHAMSDTGDARMASMKAMQDMRQGMRAAHRIKDPDLSFICGMIAHHRGAVAMSRVELQSGKDEQAKAWAAKIIEDQEREIAAFEAWAADKAK